MAFSYLQQVPVEVAESLGHYVYVLRDPRSGSVFYVGKGVGSRVYTHVRESERGGEHAKLERIKSIHADGLEVDHLLVRTGLTEEEAFIVEQSCIDALTTTGVQLTNKVRGHGTAEFGLATIQAAIARLSAPPAPPFTEPTAVFIINRAWESHFTPLQTYEATRGH